MPKLSIVIPVYNSERYLRDCVDSVLNQKYKDFELILVDDGSTDGSVRICDEYASYQNVKVVHQKNQGVSVARNRGIDEAEGEWISFVDSDDVVADDYAECFFQQDKYADLTYFSHANFYNDSEKQYILESAFCDDRISVEKEIHRLKNSSCGFEFFGYTWNKFFRLNIIREHYIRFVEGLRFREDEIFTSQYCHYIKSLAVIPNVLYKYKCMNNGLTSQEMQSDDFLWVAKLVEQCAYYYTNTDLRRYENFRIMYMLLDAMKSSHSLFERYKIASEIRMFDVRCKGLYDKDRLPYGLVKNVSKPLRLLLWLYRRSL